MFKAFANAFKIEDLRKKIIITLALLCVLRIGSYIPVPGIDHVELGKFIRQLQMGFAGQAVFGMMDLFTGGAMSQLTVFALGIMPYISASIIFQLLTAVVPSLEKLAKEGESGRRKLNTYIRYAAIGIGIFQAMLISVGIENPRNTGGFSLVLNPGLPFRFVAILSMATGTTFIMWLGEQIQEYGIGNGMSLIIAAGIVSRIPAAIGLMVEVVRLGQVQAYTIIPLLVLLVAVTMAIVLITQAARKIPVQYAKRVVGRKVYGGASTYIPLRVNQAGVIPIIFAQTIIMFPAVIASFIPNEAFRKFADWLTRGHILYTSLYAMLIIIFAYFYTAIVFNPIDIAENMKKYGGFVPGIRPGKPTADYFDFVMTRITLPGALFLALVAIFPDLITYWFRIPYLPASFFGGTGLLIVVGVMLDTSRQIETHLLMRDYEGFMKKGRIKGRR
ncbi:preprotein translocase subunit SecY [bacterium Unc6]|nr:preprotein translocase subunit SecY [bacterium Unc6]